MFADQRQAARINLKMLVIVFVGAVVLAAGTFVVHRVRKGMMLQAALAEGTAAYENQDWATAGLMLGRWLAARPMDAEVLSKFAHAQLSIRPLERRNIARAISAYRRLLRIDPSDEAAFKRLTLLYETTGNLGELEYVARKRLEGRPSDALAIVSQAKVLLVRQKHDDARAVLEKFVEKLAAEGENPPELVEACILLAPCLRRGPTRRSNGLRDGWSEPWKAARIRRSPWSSVPRCDVRLH